MEKNETTEPEAAITPSQKTIEQGAGFIGGVLSQAALGRHTLTVSTARGVDYVTFSKSPYEIILDDDDHRKLYEAVLVALEMDKVFGASLRSTAGAAAPEAPTEVRGWVVTSFSIRALTADEIIESYCVDHETGKINSPEPDVAYLEGWEIRSIVED